MKAQRNYFPGSKKLKFTTQQKRNADKRSPPSLPRQIRSNKDKLLVENTKKNSIVNQIYIYLYTEYL